MIVEHSLSTFRTCVVDAFKARLEHFSHYTLHGREHLEELDRLALLMGQSIPALSKARTNLLRLATAKGYEWIRPKWDLPLQAEASRKAVEVNPKNDGAWNDLAVSPGRQADDQTDATHDVTWGVDRGLSQGIRSQSERRPRLE